MKDELDNIYNDDSWYVKWTNGWISVPYFGVKSSRRSVITENSFTYRKRNPI